MVQTFNFSRSLQSWKVRKTLSVISCLIALLSLGPAKADQTVQKEASDSVFVVYSKDFKNDSGKFGAQGLVPLFTINSSVVLQGNYTNYWLQVNAGLVNDGQYSIEIGNTHLYQSCTLTLKNFATVVVTRVSIQNTHLCKELSLAVSSAKLATPLNVYRDINGNKFYFVATGDMFQ